MEIAVDDKLVLDNLNLVPYLINKYIHVSPTSQDYSDYYQEGCVGLVLAASRYDNNRKIKFSTYAASYILGYLYNYKYLYLPIIKYPRRRINNKKKVAMYVADNPDATPAKIMDDLKLTSDEFIECYYDVNYLQDWFKVDGTDSEDAIIWESLLPDTSIADRPDNISATSAFDTLRDMLGSDIFSNTRANDIAHEYLRDMLYSDTYHTQKWYAAKYHCSRSTVNKTIKDLKEIIREKLKEYNN